MPSIPFFTKVASFQPPRVSNDLLSFSPPPLHIYIICPLWSIPAQHDAIHLGTTQLQQAIAMQCPVLPTAATREHFIPIRWDGISAASNFYLLYRSLFSTVTYEENHPACVLQVLLEWSHMLCRPTEMHRLRFCRADGPADHTPELRTLVTGDPITLFSRNDWKLSKSEILKLFIWFVD